MTDVEFELPALFAYVATVAWAFSGALVAIRKRFDIVGVFVVALLSSTGGSLLRDTFFLRRDPVLLTDPVYLPLIAGTTVLMGLFAAPLMRFLSRKVERKLVEVVDAVGIPCFAVVGMQLAAAHGIPLAGVLFVGIAIPDDPRRVGYYADFDLEAWGRHTIGDDFVDYAAKS